MRRFEILVLAGVLGVVAATAGCLFRIHRPPKPGKPAASVMFHITHHHSPMLANRFRNRVWIDDRLLPFTPVRAGAVAPRTRVKPGWRKFQISSYFAYHYSRVYPYYYRVRIAYACGSTTCYRYETRRGYRRRYFTRPLGSCRRFVQVFLYTNSRVTFRYNYMGPQSCNLICHQQVMMPNGRYQVRPCRIGRVGR